MKVLTQFVIVFTFQLVLVITQFADNLVQSQQSRNLLQQVSVASDICAFKLDGHADGIAVDEKLRKTEDISECCSLCNKEPSCNVFTYCPLEAGCQDQGIDIPVVEYQTCILKYQQQVGDGKIPLYLKEGILTEFQSGYILDKKAAETLLGFQRAMISYGGEDYEEQDDVVYEECTDIQPARFSTCQERLAAGGCNDRWMVLRDYCAYTCGRCTSMQPTSQCTFVDNFNAKGTLIDFQIRYARNKEECCRMCSDHHQCNVFVFCEKSSGCKNERFGDVVAESKKCDLKYQEIISEGGEPDSWFSGPNTDFTSGYIPITGKSSQINGYQITNGQEPPVQATISPPTPTPTPTPSPRPLNFASTRPQGIFQPSFLGLKNGQALIQFSYYESQNSLLQRLTNVKNVGECCKKCVDNKNCNFFGFCGDKSGCLVDGVGKDYQMCELKYDQFIALRGLPQNWEKGSDEQLFQGVISGYIVDRNSR